MDTRKPSESVGIFKNDDSIISSIAWHPDEGSNRLCTVSNDGKVLIYEVNKSINEQRPVLCYDGEEKIVNCAWGSANQNWIGVAFDSKIQTLKI